jgi:hypothetical protein
MAHAIAVQVKIKIKAMMREVTMLFCVSLVCAVKYFVMSSTVNTCTSNHSRNPFPGNKEPLFEKGCLNAAFPNSRNARARQPAEISKEWWRAPRRKRARACLRS